MTLGERIKTIIKERGLTQIAFAKALGISVNYANTVANDSNKVKSISETLAKLIEETYGYSAEWVMNGTGDKMAWGDTGASRAEILKKIQKMSDAEVNATLAFVETLQSVNKRYPTK